MHIVCVNLIKCKILIIIIIKLPIFITCITFVIVIVVMVDVLMYELPHRVKREQVWGENVTIVKCTLCCITICKITLLYLRKCFVFGKCFLISITYITIFFILVNISLYRRLQFYLCCIFSHLALIVGFI